MKLLLGVLAAFLPAIYAQTCPTSAVIGDCLGTICPTSNTCVATKCCKDSEIFPFPAGSCSDKKADCPRKRDLCFQAEYVALMAVQCQKTCGKCSDSVAPVNNCLDKLANCPSKSAKCSNPQYKDKMTVDCPKTCGRCPRG